MKLIQYFSTFTSAHWFSIIQNNNTLRIAGLTSVMSIQDLSENLKEFSPIRFETTPITQLAQAEQIGEDFEKLEDFDSIFAEFLV